ncbi:MerR family transcriptional regulator [Novosphingobium colocasiae]|uniref:MerR family transcriptional regulator n=1 Tax=Novosphingobium colocasiae TaxID=1256513 RepID=UPI0035B2B1B5
MKMGELERRTGVNRETIRVLIRKGLVPPPDKPKATVAFYNEEHVRAVQAVRNLQREHQVTLDQMSSILRGESLKKRLEAPAFQHLEELVAARFGEDDRTILVQSLAQTNAYAQRDAAGLAALGAIEIMETPEGSAVSYTDASLIRIWERMREAGYEETTNFFPVVLDHYTKSADYLAYAEATRFIRRTEGLVGEEEAADMLRIGLPLMLDFFGILRMKYFMRYLAAAQAGTLDALPKPVLDKPGAAGPAPKRTGRSGNRK